MLGTLTQAVRRAWPTHTLSVRVTGRADPDTVWSRYADTRLWPTWAPHLVRVDASSPLIAEGVTGTVTGIGGVRADFRITDVDVAGRRWSWTVTAGPVSMELHHAVLRVSDGSTVTTLRLRGPVGIADSYLPVAMWALRSLVAR